MKNYLFVANWKTYLSFDEMATWCDQCAQAGTEWSDRANIILCPELIHLAFVYTVLESNISIGAQDCSAHVAGPFTGEVSPAHLAEIDIFSTIIGHYERRLYYHETAPLIAEKCLAAIKNGLTPIVCVTGPEDAQKIFQEVFLATKKEELTPKTIICAYEPPQSIGTGVVPDVAQIDVACQKIREILEHNLPKTAIFMLYGGSVQESNAKNLSNIRHIDGLLIGKASTDFQAFKNIVSFFMDRAF